MFGRKSSKVTAPATATAQDFVTGAQTLIRQGYSLPVACALVAEVASPSQLAEIIAAYESGTLR